MMILVITCYVYRSLLHCIAPTGSKDPFPFRSVHIGSRAQPASRLVGTGKGLFKKRHSRLAARDAKIRKCDASKPRFPYAKEFDRKLSVFWARALRNVRQPLSYARNVEKL